MDIYELTNGGERRAAPPPSDGDSQLRLCQIQFKRAGRDPPPPGLRPGVRPCAAHTRAVSIVNTRSNPN
ncbi:hypothetical protein EVAR_91431_1 [Eumeta japonica]|uniref:Uncharacterized protein n=1 Tax=Eumeta variegata TaxID=151549 RepID=A0A4C1X347_EUMVA|nr:hypothetical protein EVAR_91431_1 [Eumeta japonica]